MQPALEVFFRNQVQSGVCGGLPEREHHKWAGLFGRYTPWPNLALPTAVVELVQPWLASHVGEQSVAQLFAQALQELLGGHAALPAVMPAKHGPPLVRSAAVFPLSHKEGEALREYAGCTRFAQTGPGWRPVDRR